MDKVDMPKVKIGLIADDLTGASDAASFLVKSGHKTLMTSSIGIGPVDEDIDAKVIALKSRSIDPEEAVRLSLRSLEDLKDSGFDKVYFKYCSTFDSTKKGNIGPVLDALIEEIGEKYTIICPSLPVNGRTVKDGILYVHGVPLSESPMKDHPLNPMWDSYIPNLMKEQSSYPCYVITRDELKSGEYKEKIEGYARSNDHFYIVPDHEDDDDARLICACFKDLRLYSGGSGLLEHLDIGPKKGTTETFAFDRTIILSGSCSKQTKKQVETYKKSGKKSISIDAYSLLQDDPFEDLAQALRDNDDVLLVYSDGIDQQMDELRETEGFHQASLAMEELLSRLSEEAVRSGYKNIVVAGGETSGAVTDRLGHRAYVIGKEIDPGVPELFPEGSDIRLVLKSGNFGSDDFFLKVS